MAKVSKRAASDLCFGYGGLLLEPDGWTVATDGHIILGVREAATIHGENSVAVPIDITLGAVSMGKARTKYAFDVVSGVIDITAGKIPQLPIQVEAYNGPNWRAIVSGTYSTESDMCYTADPRLMAELQTFANSISSLEILGFGRLLERQLNVWFHRVDGEITAFGAVLAVRMPETCEEIHI